MTQQEALRIAHNIFNECIDARCPSMSKYDLNLLENYARTSIECATKGDWKSALRWAKRCVKMEKEVGFSNAPIWGEFRNAIKRINQEFPDSSS